MLSLVDKANAISDFLDRQVGRILIILMTAEICVIFSAVIARYVFNNSFTWSDEVSRGMLTWLIFLGASSAARNGELLGITIVAHLLPIAGRRALAAMVYVMMAVFLYLVIDISIDLMQRTARQSTFVLRLPLNYVTAAIPVSFALILLHLAVHIAKVIRGDEEDAASEQIQNL